LILLANRVNPATYFKKAFPVLSFAFVSRSSAGALPLNIETQHKALGVDSASANLAASFGMSIGQNGCAGVYPAMLATIVAPTVGIDVLSPTFFVPLIAVVANSCSGGRSGEERRSPRSSLGTIASYRGGGRPRIRGAAHRHGSHRPQRQRLLVAGITASHVAGGLDRSVLTIRGACHRRGARELTGMVPWRDDPSGLRAGSARLADGVGEPEVMDCGW
ncbi:MAG: cation:dicarboxylate symporter family transporter, partial [Adlercreutzia equolifaciens]